MSKNVIVRTLFFAVVILQIIVYAPFGINETDGGFLTGLAWQTLSGKALYLDAIYVRPPLPVWLRALEVSLFPDGFAILAERCVFFVKIAVYSFLAADLLENGSRRWVLSAFAFVVSCHNYPPMAWHTVDGIFFSVLGVHFIVSSLKPMDTALDTPLTLRGKRAISGFFIFCALLCKQSFYPMAAVFALLVLGNRQKLSVWPFVLGFSLPFLTFLLWLWNKGVLFNFFEMTSGAATSGQAFQHGILDFFRISPVVGIGLVFAVAGFWNGIVRGSDLTLGKRLWQVFLLWLLGSFLIQVIVNQAYTAPFAQARILFWLAVFWAGWLFFKQEETEKAMILAGLIAVSWCSAISWGYNLPILFATPGVFAVWQITSIFRERLFAKQAVPQNFADAGRAVSVFGGIVFLMMTFWSVNQYVYRDENRDQLTVNLGEIYPKLNGVFSSPETAGKYSELKKLTLDFGENSVVLPSFPQADFLNGKAPVLPLNWVVNRETNGRNKLIYKVLEEKQPTVFIEKIYGEKLLADPQFEVSKAVLTTWKKVGETVHFLVFQHGE